VYGDKEGDSYKNFGLNQVEFIDLTDQLKKNDAQLFEKIFLSQFEETMQYIIRTYNAQHENAYDATMDALLDFRNRIVEDKISYGNLRFLFTRIASQFYLRNIKKFQFTDVDENLIEEVEPTTNDEDLRTLKLAWENMGDNCRQLLHSHIHNKQKLKDIATQLKKSQEAIRKQKERCIKKLIQLFKESSINRDL